MKMIFDLPGLSLIRHRATDDDSRNLLAFSGDRERAGVYRSRRDASEVDACGVGFVGRHRVDDHRDKSGLVARVLDLPVYGDIAPGAASEVSLRPGRDAMIGVWFHVAPFELAAGQRRDSDEQCHQSHLCPHILKSTAQRDLAQGAAL